MSLLYAREFMADIATEMLQLAPAHYAEVGDLDMPLVPCVDTYLAMERVNAVICFTARLADETGLNVLVGYAVFTMVRHPHSGQFCANQDLLFVEPAHRGTGHEFIAWCDDQLAARGVAQVRHFVTERHDFSRTLELQGYQKTETVWSKKL